MLREIIALGEFTVRDHPLASGAYYGKMEVLSENHNHLMGIASSREARSDLPSLSVNSELWIGAVYDDLYNFHILFASLRMMMAHLCEKVEIQFC